MASRVVSARLPSLLCEGVVETPANLWRSVSHSVGSKMSVGAQGIY